MKVSQAALMIAFAKFRANPVEIPGTFCVSCLDDEGNRVRTTRKDFATKEAAEHYASGCAKSRWPQVHRLCCFCGSGWNDGYCSDCGAG